MSPTRGKPRQEDVIETFDAHASTWAELYRGETTRAHKFLIRRKRVFELVDRQGGRMLDVGCGPGVTVEHFVQHGFEFFGVDAAPNAIAECVRRFGNVAAAHFSIGRIDALDFPDAFFDVVTCMGVIQYLDDRNAALEELSRVCKPDGLVILTLPNRWSPIRRWNRTMARGMRRMLGTTRGGFAIGELTHTAYGEDECRRLLTAHGLHARQFVYSNFEVVPFPFDRLLPSLTVAASRRLEPLGRGTLRKLGSEFVIQAERR